MELKNEVRLILIFEVTIDILIKLFKQRIKQQYQQPFFFFYTYLFLLNDIHI